MLGIFIGSNLYVQGVCLLIEQKQNEKRKEKNKKEDLAKLKN